jgi:hypothetical protein
MTLYPATGQRGEAFRVLPKMILRTLDTSIGPVRLENTMAAMIHISTVVSTVLNLIVAGIVIVVLAHYPGLIAPVAIRLRMAGAVQAAVGDVALRLHLRRPRAATLEVLVRPHRPRRPVLADQGLRGPRLGLAYRRYHRPGRAFPVPESGYRPSVTTRCREASAFETMLTTYS